jgi:hypothetical protein
MASTRRQQGWATLPRSWTRKAGIRRLVAGYEDFTEALARKIARSKDSRRRMRNLLQRPFRESVGAVSMSETTRDELNKLYKPHIAALEDLLERSFAEWRC